MEIVDLNDLWLSRRKQFFLDKGLLPDYIYYQFNGKSAQENYEEQNALIKQRLLQRKEKEKQQRELENYVKEEVEKRLDICLEKALEDVLKGFK